MAARESRLAQRARNRDCAVICAWAAEASVHQEGWGLADGGRPVCRSGVYTGHGGEVLQMLCLGDHLLSLGEDRRLLLWKCGEYDEPQVRGFKAEGMGESLNRYKIYLEGAC